MRCAQCGGEHDDLEPAFRRPDVAVALATADRAARVKEDDDLCRILGRTDADPTRWFVRCVLPVRVLDGGGEVSWGIWAEVSELAFARIVERWRDADQAAEPAMEATLANRVPGFPDTRGLAVRLRLTGPTSRASLSFSAEVHHAFAAECRDGVTRHRVHEWLCDLEG